MTTKSIRKTQMGTTAPKIQTGDLHQAEIDALIARNRDVLNESIEISRDEIARGIHSERTVDDIIAAGMNRNSLNG